MVCGLGSKRLCLIELQGGSGKGEVRPPRCNRDYRVANGWWYAVMCIVVLALS